jgi:hypothetical protein
MIHCWTSQLMYRMMLLILVTLVLMLITPMQIHCNAWVLLKNQTNCASIWDPVRSQSVWVWLLRGHQRWAFLLWEQGHALEFTWTSDGFVNKFCGCLEAMNQPNQYAIDVWIHQIRSIVTLETHYQQCRDFICWRKTCCLQIKAYNADLLAILTYNIIVVLANVLIADDNVISLSMSVPLYYAKLYQEKIISSARIASWLTR